MIIAKRHHDDVIEAAIDEIKKMDNELILKNPQS